MAKLTTNKFMDKYISDREKAFIKESFWYCKLVYKCDKQCEECLETVKEKIKDGI